MLELVGRMPKPKNVATLWTVMKNVARLYKRMQPLKYFDSLLFASKAKIKIVV
jgi:hypothetical protein